MKRHIFILFLILISPAVYSQNEFGDINSISKHYETLFNYIKSPNACDTVCISDLNNAKQDYDKGILTFYKPIGFLYGFFRFDDEIENACKTIGLRYKIVPESDVIFECQTQGC
jgi:hypothetical protein